jgi:hypothetical protein
MALKEKYDRLLKLVFRRLIDVDETRSRYWEHIYVQDDSICALHQEIISERKDDELTKMLLELAEIKEEIVDKMLFYTQKATSIAVYLSKKIKEVENEG